MTYCAGVLLEKGLVLASDRRTNAGVDQVASVCKMRVFEDPGRMVAVLLSAGNLAVSQSVLALLHEAKGTGDPDRDILTAPTLYRAARIVGEAVREVHSVDAGPLQASGATFNASFLLGGQIDGEPHRLFQIYSAGNFIEAQSDTPYMQIGETKYGKPVLDRLLTVSMQPEEAVTCVLLSFSSTMRSNISVGLPIDVACYRHDSLTLEERRVIQEGDTDFADLQTLWNDGLRRIFIEMPAISLTPHQVTIPTADPTEA